MTGKIKKKKAAEKKSRPMPFNYCDYRCERCAEQDNCRVYKDDRDRVLEHYVKGEDPYNPRIFADDLKEIFEKTRKMISRIAEEEDIDLGAVPDEEIPKIEPGSFVLYRLAQQYCMDAHALIKKKRREGFPQCIEEEWGDFVWHHTLLPAKTARLVAGIIDDDLDKDWRKAEEDGTVAVIIKSVTLSRQALQVMLSELPDDLHDIADLLELLGRFEKQLQTDTRQKVGGKTAKRSLIDP
jgi:hypothetical protein